MFHGREVPPFYKAAPWQEHGGPKTTPEREERGEEAGSQLSPAPSPAEAEGRPGDRGAAVMPHVSETAGSCRAGSAGSERGRLWNQQGHLQQGSQRLARESGNDL